MCRPSSCGVQGASIEGNGAITSDWEAAACSVNLGGPISQHRPRSKIVKDVNGLVDRLSAQTTRAADRPRGLVA